jgi:hypothetical protein
MAIQITKNPEILVQLSIPAESILINDFALTLNAIRNSTCYEFQRKDVSVYNVTDNGSGYCRIKSLGLITFSINSSVYLSSGLYADSGTITDIGIDGGVNFIDVDIEFITATSGGFVNIASDRKNYEVEVRLFYGYNNYTEYPHYLRTIPDTTGKCILDISTALRYICNKENNINYDYSATQDLLNSGLFYIQYREVWKDYTGSWLTAQSYWQYLYSVLQPPRPIYNNVMEQYEMSFSRETKFLTAFAKPKYFVGYPFSVSYYSHILFINSDLQFNKIIKYKNINKVVRDTETTALSNTNNFGLMHLVIDNIECTDEYLSIQLNITDGDCEDNCYVEPNYVECGYVACGTPTGSSEWEAPDPPPIIPEAIPI